METVKNVFEEMFEDIVGPNQTLNNCGKVVYKLDDLARLKRFMFLGSENNSLYINKNEKNNFFLTKENLICLENLLVQERYDDILNVIIEYKDRSFKKDYLLYVLARCCSIKLPQHTSDWGSDNIPRDFKADCFKLTSDICSIPTHLFLFIELYEVVNKRLYNTTGWNSYMKRMISSWYNSKSVKDLMYHITKYQNRNNWTHRDVLRLTHIKNSEIHYNNIYKYIVKGEEVLTKELTLFESDDNENKLVYLLAFERLKTEESLDTVLRLINKYNFVREHVPTRWLNERKIWEALLPGMPMTATLRNLNKMTAIGLFDGGSAPQRQNEEYEKTNLQLVTEKLSKESILKSKVHPLQILIAIKMYSQGKGDLGKMVWTPNQKIVGALNDAFYYAFDNVKKGTGKRYLLALDVSGSMSSATVCGINCLNAAEVSCAMAMVYDCVEENVDMMAFSNTFVPVSVSSSRRLDDNLSSMRQITFGATDCSLPMTWATERKKEYDCIIVFTDSETNCNKIQPSVALKRYRETLNINTKLVVCGLSSNGFTLADPNNNDMLDICGFDSSTHEIINEFVNEF